MDTTELAVDHRQAMLGTVKTWRVNGASGDSTTPNVMVGGRPLCRLDFSGDIDHNGAVDWLDGAKLVRERMPQIPTHSYDNKLMYKIDCDEPKLAKPRATFADAKRIIQQVALLTAGAPQDVYLSGWQYSGNHTGFPAVAEVNKRLGGFEALQALLRDAREMNATVSLSDDFDDAYQSSPAWDSNIVARRPDGELWESGEGSYIIGLAKYMEGPGPDRIRYTADRYKIRDTYFLDAFSENAIRNDWDRDRPASGVKNLVDGRFKIIDEFKKRGMDVVSDELRYVTLGRVSVNGNGPVGEESPFGGEAIPLVAAIYRKSAIWGMRGQTWQKQPELNSFFYNGHDFPSLPAEDWEHHFTSFYYGTLAPWYQLHSRSIEGYLRDGDRTVISLEGNAKIDLDWSRDQYSVSVGGVEVARDGDTFCPIGQDRIAFYSKSAKRLSTPLPQGWDGNIVVGLALSADKVEQAPVSVRDGLLSVNVQAGKPIMVFRDAAARKAALAVRSAL
jgi:hypothetical protein